MSSVDKKLATGGYTSGGAKKGRSGGSRRTWRASKRGAKAKAIKLALGRE